MKRVMAAIPLIITLLFTGCTNSDNKLNPIPNESTSSSKVTSSSMPPQSKSESVYSAAWVSYYKQQLPVSYIKDGKQLLKNKEAEWVFDIEKRLKISVKLKGATQYDTRLIYAGSAQNPYDNPLPHSFFNDKPAGSKLLIYGDWNPFVVKVRYVNYTLENQPNNKSWSKFFNAKIEKKSKHTPLIIRNAWFFDIDGDGKEESFVNASNTVLSDCILKQNIPAYKDTATYTLSAYFKSDGTAVDLGRVVQSRISTKPLDENKNVYESYNVGKNDPEELQYINAYQYDKNDKITVCPIFSFGRGDYERETELTAIIVDINGDGKAEFMTMPRNLYAPLNVYSIDNNGLPHKEFSITTPA